MERRAYSIEQGLHNVDLMLQQADDMSIPNHATAQSIGALIIAVSNLRDVVKEMYESKAAEKGVTNASTI